jgi:hypothetical protein
MFACEKSMGLAAGDESGPTGGGFLSAGPRGGTAFRAPPMVYRLR